MKKFYFLSTALLFSFLNCFSQPFTFDPSFGVKGRVYTNLLDINKADEAAKAVAIQADGKIIMAGSTKMPAAVIRYNTNGTLDNSFDHDGMAFCFGLSINAISIQSDGKILAAGVSNNDFALIRFNTDGSFDNSFDSDGRLATSIGAGSDAANCMILQSDGKIVLAGYSFNGSDNDFAIARYNSNGIPDNSFDGDGKLVIPVGSAGDQITSIAVQNDGKIVAAGQSYNGSFNDFAVVRLNTDGSTDNTFDGDGKLTTNISDDGNTKTVIIQNDGKIVVGGLNGINVNYQGIVLCRYNSNGSPDNSFDGDGKLVISNSFLRQIHSMVIQADGKVLLAGTNNNSGNGNFNFALARLNADGNLDSSFDGDGTLITAIGPVYNRAIAVAVQSDGKIVAAGKAEAAGGTYEDFALARYNTDGSPDNSFGITGTVITNVSSSFDVPRSVNIQTDGKIIVAGSGGSVDVGSTSHIGVVRYNTDGSLDNSFGGNGKVITAASSPANIPGASALQPDGKILVAGTSSASNSDFLLLRYNNDGSLDNSFDGDGMATTDFGTNDYPSCIAIQSDGKIVVAGYSGGSNTFDFAIARYNSNGSPDNSFDGDGKIRISLSSWDDVVRALVIQPDGKIVVAGTIGTGYNVDIALLRFNSDGSPDNSFDGDGQLITDISSSIDDVYCMAIQPDGKIVIGGTTRIGENNYYFILVRYNTDGNLDNSFDGDGKLIGTTGNNISSIIIQGNGKILAGAANFSLYRFNPDGTPDNTFDGDGRVTIDQSNGNIISLQNMKIFANRIYVSGVTQTAGNSDFGLAAVLNDILDSPLPLTLLDFSGKLPNEHALLSWKTENEINASKFIVERSADGRNYIPVGSVNTLNNAGTNYYNFTDYNVKSLGTSILYYRLKQTDIDGRFTYSRIVALPLDKSRNMVLFYPNPVINDANLTITVNRRERLQVKIIDNKGSIVKQQQWDVSAGSTSLSIDVQGLPKGMYYLELKGETISYKKQFVK